MFPDYRNLSLVPEIACFLLSRDKELFIEVYQRLALRNQAPNQFSGITAAIAQQGFNILSDIKVLDCGLLPVDVVGPFLSLECLYGISAELEKVGKVGFLQGFLSGVLQEVNRDDKRFSAKAEIGPENPEPIDIV